MPRIERICVLAMIVALAATMYVAVAEARSGRGGGGGGGIRAGGFGGGGGGLRIGGFRSAPVARSGFGNIGRGPGRAFSSGPAARSFSSSRSISRSVARPSVTRSFVARSVSRPSRVAVGKSVTVGKNVAVGKNVTVGKNVAAGKEVTVGKNFTAGKNDSLGKNFFVGQNQLNRMANNRSFASRNVVNASVRGVRDAQMLRNSAFAKHAVHNGKPLALAHAKFQGGWAGHNWQHPHEWHWRHHHPIAVIGWFGPLFWPYAYSDFIDYTYWPYAYDAFWPYAYDDLYVGVFGPYAYEGAAYLDDPPSVSTRRGPASRRSPAGGAVVCQERSPELTNWPI